MAEIRGMIQSASALTGMLSNQGSFVGDIAGIRGLKGDKGDPGDTGDTGNGIASIQKTGTQGLVDTYTITFTNGSTTTFTVTNGQNGTGSVSDVWVNGTSVLDGNTAKVVVPTKITDLTDDSDFVSEDIIADEYSTSSTYSAGDYCIYNGQFYRCTTEISTAEAWNSAHWTAVTVADEITDLKGDIPQNVSDLTNDSGYQTASQVASAVDYAKVLPLTFPAFSSLPQTLTDSRITSTMVMVGWYVANDSAKTSEWTVTPANGSVTVSGSISGSTTLMIILAETM